MLHPHIKPEKLDRQASLDIHDDALTFQPGQMYVSAIGIVSPSSGVANIQAPVKKPRKRRIRAQPSETSTRARCFLCNKPCASRTGIFNHLLAGACGSGISSEQTIGLFEQYGQKNNIVSLACPENGCKSKLKNVHGLVMHIKSNSDHEDPQDLADEAFDWVQEILVDCAGGRTSKGALEGVDVVKKSKSY